MRDDYKTGWKLKPRSLQFVNVCGATLGSHIREMLSVFQCVLHQVNDDKPPLAVNIQVPCFWRERGRGRRRGGFTHSWAFLKNDVTQSQNIKTPIEYLWPILWVASTTNKCSFIFPSVPLSLFLFLSLLIKMQISKVAYWDLKRSLCQVPHILIRL